jgi:hypothetical protein
MLKYGQSDSFYPGKFKKIPYAGDYADFIIGNSEDV